VFNPLHASVNQIPDFKWNIGPMFTDEILLSLHSALFLSK